MTAYKTVDAYIQSFPEDTQKILEKLRQIVKTAAPEAEECISYGMPAYKYNGPLVYFAAYTKHIGFYPVPSGIESFRKELAPYIKGKGTVQFPLNQPIPYGLVKEVVQFRVKENIQRAK